MTCSFCNSKNYETLVDFGDMALAGGFLKPSSFDNEKKYPMTLIFCKDCYSVQILEKIDPVEMFNDYFYFSSAINTLSSHFEEYALEVKEKFKLNSDSKVLEFGCNDGVLLKPLSKTGIGTVIGVDPASNVISTIKEKNIHLYPGFFNEEMADTIKKDIGDIDVIMANNVYAHIVDIQSTTRAIKQLLTQDGVFIFEVHYLGNVISDLQYDMVYHEHIYYYSLVSAIEHFKRYDMQVFDIKKIPIHGGSYRFYVKNNTGEKDVEVSSSVKELENKEICLGYKNIQTYNTFSKSIYELREDLNKLLKKLKFEGKKVYGYGASGRANTVIQFCNIDSSLIDFIVDDAPAKQGFFTPGSHIEITTSEILKGENKPDYILLFAWTFEKEIRQRNKDFFENGGKIILPLPEIKILDWGKRNYESNDNIWYQTRND